MDFGQHFDGTRAYCFYSLSLLAREFSAYVATTSLVDQGNLFGDIKRMILVSISWIQQLALLWRTGAHFFNAGKLLDSDIFEACEVLELPRSVDFAEDTRTSCLYLSSANSKQKDLRFYRKKAPTA